jgi:hypothetical protein
MSVVTLPTGLCGSPAAVDWAYRGGGVHGCKRRWKRPASNVQLSVARGVFRAIDHGRAGPTV